MNKVFIGFDTSAYTTSVGAVDENGRVLFDKRHILQVKKGERGLRQQDAVFQHLNNLPGMIEDLCDHIDVNKVSSVSVSTRPRNIEGSYMPVFQVGKGQAFILSKVLGVKYNEFSHQDGHIAATFISDNEENITNYESFLVLHISGGTTELLKIERKNNRFHAKIIGGTKDISAGQLIDRIGVKLGYSFPCGKEVDKVSQNGELIEERIPVSTKDSWINFSGTETFFQRLIDKEKYKREDIAKSLLHSVYLSLKNIIEHSLSASDLDRIIITGGVAANSYLRSNLCECVGNNHNTKIVFPERKYCTDNAIGIAYLGSIEELEAYK